MRLLRAAAVVLVLAAPVGFTLACGSRTGLLLSEFGTPLEDGGAPIPGADAPFTEDIGLPLDDALPGLDVNLPEVTPQVSCADASDTLVYVVTTSNTLLKFDPSLTQFTVIGTLDCPDPEGRTPFSMAVNRTGAAYVLYYAPAQAGTFPPADPGNIFRVNLNTAACSATSFVPGQDGFGGFGMGFASDNDAGAGETLYVASDDTSGGRLGAVNESTLTLSLVGTFTPEVISAELTGTGDGRLFAFYAPEGLNSTGSVIAQIDKSTARVIGQAQLPTVTQGDGWAFAFWGGNFYTFTNPDGMNDDPTTIVTEYNPTSGAVTQVATYPETIDGAGVSTCAPVQ